MESRLQEAAFAEVAAMAGLDARGVSMTLRSLDPKNCYC